MRLLSPTRKLRVLRSSLLLCLVARSIPSWCFFTYGFRDTLWPESLLTLNLSCVVPCSAVSVHFNAASSHN